VKKLRRLLSLIIIFCLTVNILSAKDKSDMEKLFPEIKGFLLQGKVNIYDPENLYQYIDGAAELYLAYQCKQLGVLTYQNPQEQSINIEIYCFNGPDHAFGLYTQERSGYVGNFIDIGSQGYYEQGMLNFYKGAYYVKMMSYQISDDESLMVNTGRLVADRLQGKAGLPVIMNSFPKIARTVNSERFIAKNFLGYDFFSDVFTVDYPIPGVAYSSFTLFVITGQDEKQSKERLKEYLSSRVDEIQKEKVYSVNDPYYGNIDLILKGNDIWGMYGFNNNDDLRKQFWQYLDVCIKGDKSKTNIAKGKTATSSANENDSLLPGYAVDGSMASRWSSAWSDPQWICIDLGADYLVNRVVLYWERALGSAFQIQVSKDSSEWRDVYSTQNNSWMINDISFDPVKARYVRMYGTRRSTPWGYSLIEFQVHNKK
jgi:hypothetical protein